MPVSSGTPKSEVSPRTGCDRTPKMIPSSADTTRWSRVPTTTALMAISGRVIATCPYVSAAIVEIECVGDELKESILRRNELDDRTLRRREIDGLRPVVAGIILRQGDPLFDDRIEHHPHDMERALEVRPDV